jgi:hypothetical protein
LQLGKLIFLTVVLGLTACGDADKSAKTKTGPQAVSQAVEVVGSKITASSQMKEWGPEGLLITSSPGWHAQYPPKYPEQIMIDFRDPRQFSTIGLYPQSGYADRNPKAFDIEGSMDGVAWSQIISVVDGCRPQHTGWIDFPLKQANTAKYIRLTIKANCGSNYLTLMGLRFQ